MTGTLEGHWVLDEDSGSTAYDYSGNGNDGSITGAGPAETGTVTGPFGNSAYDFDGSDDEVDFGNPSNISFDTTDFSVGGWINPRTNGDVWFANGDVGSSSAPGWRLDLFGGEIRAFVSDGTDAIQPNTGISPTTGQWYFVMLTLNRAGDAKIYVNGVQEASVSATAIDNISNSSNVRLGRRSGGSPSYYDGRIANCLAYSRTLSPQEVQALYQAGVQSEVTFEQ